MRKDKVVLLFTHAGAHIRKYTCTHKKLWPSSVYKGFMEQDAHLREQVGVNP